MARFEIASPDLAAMAGCAFAAEMFYDLGIQCAAGRSGHVDLVEAHKFFNIAAAKGAPDAARMRGEIAAEMTVAAIAEAQRAARAFLAAH